MLESKMDNWTYKKALFRYGMPCVESRFKLGLINKEEYDKLCSFIGKEEEMPFELIKEHFKKPVEIIGDNKTGKDVDDYFMGLHNHEIICREGNYAHYPKEFCELCISKDGIVLEKLDDFYYKVGVGDKITKVSKKFSGDVKIGDKVRIHRGYVVRDLR
ncbi:hypothetical protein K9L16_01300 [Candidatus Pacearchaeota archaeon]|nr:hypothetical protein [Candidatus Pacearchaeota archaeon]